MIGLIKTGQAVFVGGCVRDMIMGREPHDYDIVVVGSNVAALYNDLKDHPQFKGWTGESFPVLRVGDVEIALARKEKKTGVGHTNFECETEGVTLQEDLRRRDFTMNAIAMVPNGRIIDPFQGKVAIEAGIIEAIGPHFCEDPLRVLRAARFAAQLGFTFSACGDGSIYRWSLRVNEELQFLAPERVWTETLKALRSPLPHVFFQALDDLDGLRIWFPEIDALHDRIQPEKHHPEGDAYVHTMLVLERARELDADDETMFAALVHDLGKAVTPDDQLPHHYNHESLGVPLVHQLCDRLNVPNVFRDVGVAASREHLNIHRFGDLRPTTKARVLLRLGAAHGNTMIERVTLASQADAQGRGPELKVKPYPQREQVLAAAEIFRSVRGDQFAHLKDGASIAQKLEQARAKALEHGS